MEARTWLVAMLVVTSAFACEDSSVNDASLAESGGSAGAFSGNATGGTTGGSAGASLATGGSGAAGGSTATAGSGGAATGAAGGSGIGSSNYGNPLPDDPRCAAFAQRAVAACPDEWTYDAIHWWCQEELNELYPIGCDAEFEAFLTCEDEIDCAVGFLPSCVNTYVECSNRFVQETQCVREGAGVTCPEGSYAFACRIESPPGCTQTELVGSGTRACCPPFE